MRIALVAHHARPGGGQDRYLLELARQLAPRHDVHLVVNRAEAADGLGATVHQLGLPDRPVLALSPRFARRAGALLTSLGPFDVVHGIGGSLPGATVITAQYCHPAWQEARARYDVHEGSWVDRLYHRFVDAQNVAFERRAYGSPALRHVIAVSQRTRDEIARYYGMPAARMSVVFNGADPAVFDEAAHSDARSNVRRELTLSSDSVIALLIGTYARKGLDTAIRAVASASGTAHLVVAGSGDERQARAWADAAGLAQSRLHLLGPRRDVARLYAGSDLFILPTRYEPFGMVIAEAMQASLPVVVSAEAGAAELIENGVSGFTVEHANDDAGFAAHVKRLIDDPALRRSMGEAGRTSALRVAWPNVATQTEAAYDAALSSNAPRTTHHAP